jgi:hypothetical protein
MDGGVAKHLPLTTGEGNRFLVVVVLNDIAAVQGHRFRYYARLRCLAHCETPISKGRT